MSAGEILLIIGLVLSFLLLLLFAFGYITYRITFYNNPKKRIANPYRHVKDDGSAESEFSKRLIDEMIARPYENIYVESYDGLKLRARLYMKSESAPFALQMHGYRSTPMLDFSGGGALALELGFNVIMPDQRACGESEGKTISFGYKESIDTLTWVNYIRDRWGENRSTVLFGVSLGASTVVMAAGRGLPDNVKGVFADCPYSSAKKIVMKVMRDRGLPAKLLYPILRFGTRIFGGFDPSAADAVEYAKNVKVPLVLIHGEEDGFVPPEMSREIHSACPRSALYTFPEARHGTSYIKDTARYEAIAEDFLKEVLGSGTELKIQKKG